MTLSLDKINEVADQIGYLSLVGGQFTLTLSDGDETFEGARFMGFQPHGLSIYHAMQPKFVPYAVMTELEIVYG
ncbi:hypothetical protein J2J97_32325 (plasmid) [Rhizobium bangladeshense]|uniref:hypothetical protein n=1 Tax=Rhizobium bangladeshense TaxID=1138189 RepID=UPI001A99BF1D|nr:hypothetical protein [Rhizobium bangladeshense]QSY98592.1 hypothetical protein J2J97_32325 [Rhizobium bangladeshense]